MKKAIFLILGILIMQKSVAQETLKPLKKGDKAPTSVEEMWKGYDPRKEPLDVEVLKEWEEKGAVIKVVRFRVGIFKGKKAMLAGIYGYPKGAKNLPGLVQIHGGGQFANANYIIANAKEGYATISIAWAGRIASSKYFVNNVHKQAYWDGKKDDPNYRVTTDWGGVDAYHAPCRFKESNFVTNPPSKHSVDPIKSSRNSGWFLACMGARRAITFLEQQPEVNKDKIGVYGHSMGGKLTVLTAGCDDRVKVAAPSCGGITDRYDRTKGNKPPPGVADDAYLKRITCPIIFLSPSNDFHGNVQDLPKAIKNIKSKEWRIVSSPHGNHQDLPEYEIASMLWFNQFLKGEFKMPETPKAKLLLKTADNIPSFTVTPDASKKIVSVRVFYTQQSESAPAEKYWRYAKPIKKGESWTAKLPLASLKKPLWVFADVQYKLDRKYTGAGYYCRINNTDKFNLASLVKLISAKELKAAGVKATLKPAKVIEDFKEDWENEWFTYTPGIQPNTTFKLTDPGNQAPPFAKLVLEVKSEKPNKMVVGLDTYSAEIKLKGGQEFQKFVLFPTDFVNVDGNGRLDWKGVKVLRLVPTEVQRPGPGSKAKPKTLGGQWKGKPAEYRNLCWLKGTRDELNAKRKVKLLKAKAEDGKIYLDSKYADVHKFIWKSAMNTWLDGKPLKIKDKTYKHGLTTHAPAEDIFFLGGKFKKFHTIATAGNGATISFQVYLDDKKVFDSGKTVTIGKSKVIDLDVAGAQELKLVVADGGNGVGGDHASWVDANVTK